MAIDTMESEMIESCCDGGRVTGRCTKALIPGVGTMQPLSIAKSIPVEQPPPTPDNHGPKKPVRKPRQYSLSVECPHAALAFAATMQEGAETHEEDAWLAESVKFHITHAEQHLAKYMLGDTSEEHLSHAMTRLILARQQAGLRGMRT